MKETVMFFGGAKEGEGYPANFCNYMRNILHSACFAYQFKYGREFPYQNVRNVIYVCLN